MPRRTLASAGVINLDFKFKGLRIETGRSGHVLGGYWYIFTINGKQINQQEQYAALRESVKTCVESGGKVMLPVPPKGRGIDITILIIERERGEMSV